MFCKRPLRANEVVEEFPVGRRLAFDSAKGRLWVVCRSCERWNLTPLEERWEAVETCERLFRGTRIRTSSENIGLAKHPEGLELVRIGQPLRPEFAAWRYGDQFGKRLRRRIVAGTAGGLAPLAGGVAAGGLLVGGLAGMAVMNTANITVQLSQFMPKVFFRPSDGRLRRLNTYKLASVRIQPADDAIGFRVVAKAPKKEWFEGDDARRALSAILPRVNSMGGTARTVQFAVSRIESNGHPQRFLSNVARLPIGMDAGIPGYLHRMSKPIKLALEMALHEEQERRALEGDLWRLERAWREAEEIAAISDNLLLPKRAEESGEETEETRGGD